MTDSAKIKNWDNNGDEKGLHSILKENFPNLNINIKYIPNGSTEKEIMEIFDSIYESMNQDEEIIFDITHGFRSIPMLAMTVLNYAKTIKNIQISGIYYGAYEAGVKEEGSDIMKAPIFDLTIYNSILNWSTAANSFIKFGNSKEISNLCEAENRNRQKNHSDSSYQNINKVIRNLNFLTDSISSARGKFVTGQKRQSIGASYNKFKLSLNELNEKNSDILPELKPLFHKIQDSIKDFDSENNFELGIASIKWCINNEMIQQGYTALEEAIKTYLCYYYKIDEKSKKNRENFCKNAINSLIKELNKNRSNASNSDLIRKNSWNTIKEWTKNDDLSSPELELLENIVMTLPLELAQLSYEISGFRNDINHFGFTETMMDSEKLKSSLTNFFNKFQKIIENHPI